MNKTFSHLRVSSEYSITQGLLTINQLVECAKKHSVPSLALTDKSNMFAMVKFFSKCEAQGIKPISGSSDLFVFWTSIKKSSLKIFKNLSTRFTNSLFFFLLINSKRWLSFPPDIAIKSSLNS